MVYKWLLWPQPGFGMPEKIFLNVYLLRLVN